MPKAYSTLKDLKGMNIEYTIIVRTGWRVRFGVWALMLAARLGSLISGYSVHIETDEAGAVGEINTNA